MRRFHRRRAKVGEFAHPFGAKRRPSASGWEYRANPSAASGLPSKVPNDAMISTHKPPVAPNDVMVSTHKHPVAPNDGTVSTHKTPIVPNDAMLLIHKSPIMPNEGTALFLLVFGE